MSMVGSLFSARSEVCSRDQNLHTRYLKQLECVASSTCETKILSFGLTPALRELLHLRTSQVLACMPISPRFA